MKNLSVRPLERRYVAINSDDQHLSIECDTAPTPGPDEGLIAVRYAGLNRADLLQRSGHYPPPADASPILGLEVAGDVIAVGDGITQFQLGQRVCALTHGGGYADFALAPQGQCFALPENLNYAQGAALPEALFTVWHNLFQRCALTTGERVLIHGGASGIGTLAVALCAALGHEVYTTAGTAQKCAALEALGASQAINYREQDFEAELNTLGLAQGFDVVLDMAGGDFLQKNINLAAPEGRIVNIAYLRGFTAEVNFAPVLMKRLIITASTLRAQSFDQKTRMRDDILATVFPLLCSGSIAPVIDSEFPLEQVEQAHERMRSGEHMGKILLQM
jgi:putative PIG3 family NAD(P)H quinone oxidoreductase